MPQMLKGKVILTANRAAADVSLTQVTQGEAYVRVDPLAQPNGTTDEVRPTPRPWHGAERGREAVKAVLVPKKKKMAPGSRKSIQHVSFRVTN